METDLPNGVRKYAESPVFTDHTVPDKLTAQHDLKAGVWGKLCVIAGRIEYHVPGDPPHVRVINAGKHAIIAPQQVHFVRPIGPLQFKVEFYR